MKLVPPAQQTTSSTGRVREESNTRYVLHTRKDSDSPSVGFADTLESARTKARGSYSSIFVFRYHTVTTYLGDEEIDTILHTPEFVEEVAKWHRG